ncbi:MAG: glycosyltransferase [Deltaproteobacteria bacterium]|jgi:glycosyltransferase involved in cell wall biosynthesis|nr:glycosyltransferase [Deltaproteobacteria bacterium]
MPPKLTILCIAYNQERFLPQTLEGFIRQETSFPFEAIVADDCSTDGSAEVIREYARRRPDIIKPIFRERNLGIYENLAATFSLARSEYAALCEGDDYWTDPEKLQMQVDYLESHPASSLCFHHTQVIHEDGPLTGTSSVYPQELPHAPPLLLNDLLQGNFMQTASVTYRWRFRQDDLRLCLPPDILPLDWFLHLLHAELGEIGFIPKVMAVYRRHSGGCWWNDGEGRFIQKNSLAKIRFYQAVMRRFGFKHPALDLVFFCALLILHMLKDYTRLADLCACHAQIYQAPIIFEADNPLNKSFTQAVHRLLDRLLEEASAQGEHTKMLDALELYLRVYAGAAHLEAEDRLRRETFLRLHTKLRRRLNDGRT